MLGKIIRSSTAKLNLVNDALAGEQTAGQTGLSPYLGQYGLAGEIGPDFIKYDSPTGTLYGGVYQYVKVLASSVRTPARGGLAFWVVPSTTNPEDQFIVTGDPQPSAAVPTFVAGVFLNAITPGNSGYIQVGGRASVLFDSAITAAAAGGWVTAKVSAASASPATYPADCGAALSANNSNLMATLGTAETSPTVSTISVVLLNLIYKRI